ncbi:AI-2E family transporter [Mucilaginibacter lappiensis]|uniref:PurR-regulated permease PerM n=1 Tax=Mucilaginibacter lappiensis TaxID=354630 RepID=A0A1N6SBA9_9SPHI|nr:AI-2E family transporter [Mucilaginibacter lappiensis]MBB6108426.1 putative PurR-regulated permease PerM [Mucilaginibacter lappiensis]MBB6130041.1 putative PurR-regulated permease PerM [Mucilaginibacter lappiensis]SIQ38388.1 Predicted PurR-regulated permease PerM [Mucilaginibacter lappiensis]
MSIFNYKQRNNIILVSIIILGCFLLYALSGLFSSILGAIVLFTIFRPLYLYLVEKKGWSRVLVALLIIFSSLVVIVIPFLLLSIMVVGKISSINIKSLPIEQWTSKIDAFAATNLNQPRFAENTLQKLGSFGTELFPSILSSAANIIITLLVLYFLLYFMLTQIREFEAGLLKYAPFREQHALKFASALRDSTYSNVLGQGIIAVIQGTLLAIGFYLFGIPDAVFWGVIGAFISFLPVVGAPTLSIPASILLFAQGHTLKGVLLLIYGLLVIGNIDNVLRMIINKRIANTHPIISVVGVFIGLPLFGILGLVFGPVLLSYFLLLLEIYETNRMAADRLERIHTTPEN